MPNEIINDPDYMALLDAPVSEEAVDAFDPDAEYNRPSPPIQDGWYWATVENAGVYSDGKLVPFRVSKWKNETREYHEVGVKAELLKPEDPIANGKHVYTDMALRTKPDPDRNNASGISAAYRALAGEPIKGMPGPGHVKQFLDLLATKPQCWVRVQNILRDRDEEKRIYEGKKDGSIPSDTKNPKVFYGQKKIMGLPGGTNAQGAFTGAADHPDTGNRCAARAYLVEFKGREFDPSDPFGKNKKAVTA